MSIQSVVQEAATNIDNVLAKSHKTGDWVKVNINDLNLVMEALAASWPPQETINDLTAKIQYLLDEYVSLENEGEKGNFIFPDGDPWIIRGRTEKKKCPHYYVTDTGICKSCSQQVGLGRTISNVTSEAASKLGEILIKMKMIQSCYNFHNYHKLGKDKAKEIIWRLSNEHNVALTRDKK